MSEEEAAAEHSGPDGTSQIPELTEEEREALEQQMREIRVQDLLAQTVVSLLNLSARRIVKEDEVDLEQARLGIDAVRALVALLPDEASAAIREPLSQIQLLYAQRSGGTVTDTPSSPGEGGPAGERPGGTSAGSGTGSGDGGGSGTSGLWIPGR